MMYKQSHCDRILLWILPNCWMLSLVTRTTIASLPINELSILDNSIGGGENCDIIYVLNNEVNHQQLIMGEDESRGFYLVSLFEINNAFEKEDFIWSKCLILLVQKQIPTSDVMQIGQKLQLFKPLAVMQYISKEITVTEKDQNVPFPIVFLNEKGKLAISN